MTHAEPQAFAGGVRLVLAIVVLLAVYRYAWKPTFFDAFREDIFAARSGLFLAVCDSGLGFEHPAYVRLRSVMHVMLNEACDIKLSQLFLVRVLIGRPPVADFEELLHGLEENEANRLREIHQRVLVTFAKYAFVRSPFGWLAGIVLVLGGIAVGACMALHLGVTKAKPKLRAWIELRIEILLALAQCTTDESDEFRARISSGTIAL